MDDGAGWTVAQVLHLRWPHSGVFCVACEASLDIEKVMRVAPDERDVQMELVRARVLGLEVVEERKRQVEEEGYTPGHDDAEHGHGGLATLAAQYLTDYHRGHQRRRLVQAAALALAALAAHDRAEVDKGPAST